MGKEIGMTGSANERKFEKPSRLTPTEKRILSLIAQKIPREEIANSLHISLKAVAKELHAIREKLEIGSSGLAVDTDKRTVEKAAAEDIT
ncbi:MAG: LuxR C-terminal-related transcriptional regulator [bacterium]